MNLARERLVVSIAILAGATVLAACTDNSASAGASGGAGSAGPNAATLEPPPSFVSTPSPTPPDETTPVSVDPELLGLLPESIDGIPIKEDADAAALAQNDPALSHIAIAVDAAVAVDAGNGNLVYALVVQLRPGVFGDAIYQQWRESFDGGACAAAGGVLGHAEAELGGRHAFITTCAEGLRTYHVFLDDRDVVISASSIGEGRFGEKLVAALRVPA